jgi:hypothetical protein
MSGLPAESAISISANGQGPSVWMRPARYLSRGAGENGAESGQKAWQIDQSSQRLSRKIEARNGGFGSPMRRSALMALMAASVAKSLPAIRSIVSLPFCRDPAKENARRGEPKRAT